MFHGGTTTSCGRTRLFNNLRPGLRRPRKRLRTNPFRARSVHNILWSVENGALSRLISIIMFRETSGRRNIAHVIGNIPARLFRRG